MTDVRPASQRKSGPAPWVALCLTAGLLQACAPDQSLRASRNRVFAADVAGAAKLCEVPKVAPSDNQTIEIPMGLGNDGGWCGIPVQRGGGPFDAGLLTARAAHGGVLIHQVGDFTRIDYRPERGFVGADSFTIKLLPGNAVIRINVTVTGTAKA